MKSPWDWSHRNDKALSSTNESLNWNEAQESGFCNPRAGQEPEATTLLSKLIDYI